MKRREFNILSPKLAVALLLLCTLASAQERPSQSGDMIAVTGGEVLIRTETGNRIARAPSFYIDRTEVTNAAYLRCVKAGACRAYHEEENANLDAADLPVTDVSPYDAFLFCQWAGKRLPIEAEWIMAAQGCDKQNLYPWGDQDPYLRANYVDGKISKGRDGRTWRFLAPVCHHPMGATCSGLCDMAGNAAEWVVRATDADSAAADNYVRRGGGFLSGPEQLRLDAQARPEYILTRSVDTGFRCARSAK